MGSLVSGIWDLFAGNPAAPEQAQLGGLSAYQAGLGEPLATAGAGYEEALLSGDPTRIAQALAPEITAGQNQVQQTALENANFGTRSGGTAAATEAARAGETGNIINLIGGLQSGTAGAAVGQGTGLISGAAGTLGQEANLAEERRKQEVSDIGGIASGAASIAMPFLGGAGGSAPPTLDTSGGYDPLGLNTPAPSFSSYPLESEPFSTDIFSGIQ